jgi:hypothetical protein
MGADTHMLVNQKEKDLSQFLRASASEYLLRQMDANLTVHICLS